MKPIKAGIVGFGRMAEGHLKAMRESGLYEVVGVCDITESRRAAAATNDLKVTDNLEELLEWDIELVVIVTPSAQHHSDALKAARAGKHTLVEKPMGVTAQQAEEMLAAAKENNVVLTVYHNRHFDSDYCLVKSAVREGLLGELLWIENRTADSRPAVGFGTKDYNREWRITAAAGGGTLLDFGPHWIEQILDLMDGEEVVQVFGDVRHVKWGDADDLFKIDMIFAGGGRATASKVDVAYYAPPYKWLIFGSEATLHAEKVRCEEVSISTPNGEVKYTKGIKPGDLHLNLAEHIRQGKDLIITPEHALRVMRVIQAGIDSAGTGKSLDVRI
jgi:scyllo-inositol 2-dehydrogenase (NADP+)